MFKVIKILKYLVDLQYVGIVFFVQFVIAKFHFFFEIIPFLLFLFTKPFSLIIAPKVFTYLKGKYRLFVGLLHNVKPQVSIGIHLLNYLVGFNEILINRK